MAGMSAMEKMVANMLGITPEAMHEMLTGFSALATTLKGQVETIIANQAATDARLDALTAQLERIEENVGRLGSQRSSGKSRVGSGTPSGDDNGNGTGDRI